MIDLLNKSTTSFQTDYNSNDLFVLVYILQIEQKHLQSRKRTKYMFVPTVTIAVLMK